MAVVFMFIIAAGYALLPLAVQGLVSAIDLTLSAGLWLATLAAAGPDRSAILMAIGREAFSAFASSRTLAIIGALVFLSAAALYGLQRLLGFEDD
jgi:hypothetical protein